MRSSDTEEAFQFELTWSSDEGTALLLFHSLDSDGEGQFFGTSELVKVSPVNEQSLGRWSSPGVRGHVAEVVVSHQLRRFAVIRALVNRIEDSHSYTPERVEAVTYREDGRQIATDGAAVVSWNATAMNERGTRVGAFMLPSSTRENRQFLTLDLATGRLVRDDADTFRTPENRTVFESTKFVLAEQQHLIQRGDETRHVKGLWFQALEPPADKVRRVLVATDASDATLSDSASTIAFVREGSLYASQVDKFSLDTLKEIEWRNKHSELLQNTKMIATALVIWSADNDDTFPSSLEAAAPYLGGIEIDLSQWEFHLPNVEATSIEKPTETPMVSIRVPGGRFISYADTSTRWVPDR